MLIRPLAGCALLAIFTAAAGCRTPGAAAVVARDAPAVRADAIIPAPQSDIVLDAVRPVSLEHGELQHGETAPPKVAASADNPFAAELLSVDALVAEVLDRNPGLAAAHAAWSAAANRYPQVIALDDPMLQTMIAPGSFGANSPVPGSYYVGVAQKFPWHGKRELRGEMALWEANAAAWDTHETRLRLTLAAQTAYFDYYLVARSQELNRANSTVMEDFRSTAKSKYEANQVSIQDVSLAELELAKLRQRELELLQQQQIAIARINTLLHRSPQHFLPPPTPSLTIDAVSIDAAALNELALQQRPELAALSSRIQAEQNAALLACKEYYPDFELMGRYDAFWIDEEQRGQVGLNMNVPLNRARRSAAVNEALFKVSRLQAEYAQLSDSIREDVANAAARWEQSRSVAELYQQRVLPAAEASLADAKAAYIAGTLDFQRLLMAQRQLIEEQTGQQRALAEFHRSRAELDRAVGVHF